AVNMTTSFRVPTKVRRSASTLLYRARNSAVRWCMVAPAMASCAEGRSAVGPGVKRRAFLIIPGSLNYKLEKGRIMGITEQIQKDMVEAMRGRDELRLSTLRMVKAALKNKEVDKRSPLDESEAQQVLVTLIKQRRDSIEQFQKGGRQELADKEAKEIKLIEAYLPKAMGEEEIAAAVKATITEMGSPTMKDMGTVMKNTMAKLQATGARVEGKTVSEIVKKQLGG